MLRILYSASPTSQNALIDESRYNGSVLIWVMCIVFSQGVQTRPRVWLCMSSAIAPEIGKRAADRARADIKDAIHTLGRLTTSLCRVVSRHQKIEKGKSSKGPKLEMPSNQQSQNCRVRAVPPGWQSTRLPTLPPSFLEPTGVVRPLVTATH